MPSPGKSAPKKVAAKLFILQGGAMPLSYVPVWAEPSQLLIVNWDLRHYQKTRTLILGLCLNG
jgi:hypothetical protein